jgi:uncharacterized protein with FMN-binding domain
MPIEKLRIIVLGLAIVWPVAASASAVERTWTDSSGKFTFRGELIDATGGVVRLKTSDGRVIATPLSRLSQADQQYVRLQTAAPQEQAAAARPTITGPTPAVIEFQSGSKVEGRITAWNDQRLSFVATVGGRDFTREYPLDKILAVTIGGTRHVLGQPAGGGDGPSGGSASPRRGAISAPGNSRTRTEVEALIDQQGRTQPDWWDSVPLSFPKTLDLSWPTKPPGNWNAQRNVGQYVWDVINPNPGKWREGIRLMHHLLELHAADPEKRQRAMLQLGGMYDELEQDYARAAFWYRQAGIDRDPNTPTTTKLAECYWKLGSKPMAMELIAKSTVYYSTIKLLADMGETEPALRYADAGLRGSFADLAGLYAGDACRMAGQYQRAIGYYERVLQVKPVGKAAQRIQRNHTRARANIESIKLFDTLDLGKVPDGTYQATSPAYAGDLRIAVMVAGGRILLVEVTDHKEKQFYSSIKDTTRKIVEQQSVKGVDATSGATITSEAILNATAKALAGAMR